MSSPWPESAAETVEAGRQVPESNTSYYLRIAIDADTDGDVCIGDFTHDFQRSPFFLLDEPPNKPTEIYIRPVKSETCTSF